MPSSVHRALLPLQSLTARRWPDGYLGAVQAASLSVAAIGKAMAWASGEDVTSKHAVKQVDRLLSNGGFDVWKLFASWVPFVLAERTEAVIALDWTDFEQDDQETLVASLITRHGRATPLLWTTLVKSASAGNRQLVEDQTLQQLREVIASEVKVTVVADRGFADAKFYALLRQLGFEYVVRFRADMLVTSERRRRSARPSGSRKAGARRCSGAHASPPPWRMVGAVVCVKRKGMKDSWCLATSLTEATAQQVLDVYARRFIIEETFRDVKDLKFGMGLKQVRVKTPERRDRLLLISALAQVLLTLLGAAGEALGYDKHLRVNTVKRRTHSLFTQGTYYFMAMPRMSDERLRPLVARFAQLVREHAVFREAFGLI
ncbi:IS4 family transposase [Corallococcus sp. AB050B]|nr:IS4 family transposase [Corallococcus sp. AB050B]